MAEYSLLVLSNPVAGREEEYNAWYNDIHLADVVAVPGIVSARRFRSLDESQWKYTAIYSLECDDPTQVMEEVLTRWKTDLMPTSEAFDEDTLFMTMIVPI